ncbi:Oidioi.mRNA.OKI2018_I69.chr2.g5984.t1.cds [Oikopleura dioica]|uniref:Oidioi.mRNA.OKI2018_I69.chr2.g5984.t1.cds n=1 Tax=Oikopleura dioica TaxID=34765 RepID=A0ABN7T7P6_OIKDI|nr:Oidioi.mRNA.OKI2018_I69.chr2.g5984.t1.cds [Oikopleura dioica]
MKERTMELESEQDIFETRKEIVDDFQKREATKRNEPEFIIAAREAQNCIREHDFKFSPVLNLHRPAEGVAFTAFGATPAPFSLVKVDAINAYWRELSAQKILYIDSPNEQLPKWSFRDAPLITLEHPDRQELGLPMIQAISLRARVLIEAGFIRPYKKMEQILDLVESSREKRKTATVIYKNEVTGDLHRMALRYLTKSFSETRLPLALQICYETNDPEIRSKEVFTRLKKHFKIDYIPYDEQRNCRGIILNSFMIYPRDERELTSIRSCLRKNPRILADFQIPKVEVWSKSSLILTDLDDPKNSPVVVTHKLLESGRLMNCHRDVEVSKDKPAMIVECWFDEKHPTGRPDNYDPYMKQMKEVSTLYDLKERITTTFNSKKKFKIFLEKPVDYHRMPWVWLCSAKIKGKSIGEEIEGQWIKRTYGFPVSPCDDEYGDSMSLDAHSD